MVLKLARYQLNIELKMLNAKKVTITDREPPVPSGDHKVSKNDDGSQRLHLNCGDPYHWA